MFKNLKKELSADTHADTKKKRGSKQRSSKSRPSASRVTSASNAVATTAATPSDTDSISSTRGSIDALQPVASDVNVLSTLTDVNRIDPTLPDPDEDDSDPFAEFAEDASAQKPTQSSACSGGTPTRHREPDLLGISDDLTSMSTGHSALGDTSGDADAKTHMSAIPHTPDSTMNTDPFGFDLPASHSPVPAQHGSGLFAESAGDALDPLGLNQFDDWKGSGFVGAGPSGATSQYKHSGMADLLGSPISSTKDVGGVGITTGSSWDAFAAPHTSTDATPNKPTPNKTYNTTESMWAGSAHPKSTALDRQTSAAAAFDVNATLSSSEMRDLWGFVDAPLDGSKALENEEAKAAGTTENQPDRESMSEAQDSVVHDAPDNGRAGVTSATALGPENGAEAVAGHTVVSGESNVNAGADMATTAESPDAIGSEAVAENDSDWATAKDDSDWTTGWGDTVGEDQGVTDGVVDGRDLQEGHTDIPSDGGSAENSDLPFAHDPESNTDNLEGTAETGLRDGQAHSGRTDSDAADAHDGGKDEQSVQEDQTDTMHQEGQTDTVHQEDQTDTVHQEDQTDTVHEQGVESDDERAVQTNTVESYEAPHADGFELGKEDGDENTVQTDDVDESTVQTAAADSYETSNGDVRENVEKGVEEGTDQVRIRDTDDATGDNVGVVSGNSFVECGVSNQDNDTTSEEPVEVPMGVDEQIGTPEEQLGSISEQVKSTEEHSEEQVEQNDSVHDQPGGMVEHAESLGGQTEDTQEFAEGTDEHTQSNEGIHEHTESMDEHTRSLQTHTDDMNEHKGSMTEHSERMEEHTGCMEEHTEEMEERRADNADQRDDHSSAHYAELRKEMDEINEDVRSVQQNITDTAVGVVLSAARVDQAADLVDATAEVVAETSGHVDTLADEVHDDAEAVQDSVWGVREEAEHVHEDAENVHAEARDVARLALDVSRKAGVAEECAHSVEGSMVSMEEAVQQVEETAQSVDDTATEMRGLAESVEVRAEGVELQADHMTVMCESMQHSVQRCEEAAQCAEETASVADETVRVITDNAQGQPGRSDSAVFGEGELTSDSGSAAEWVENATDNGVDGARDAVQESRVGALPDDVEVNGGGGLVLADEECPVDTALAEGKAVDLGGEPNPDACVGAGPSTEDVDKGTDTDNEDTIPGDGVGWAASSTDTNAPEVSGDVVAEETDTQTGHEPSNTSASASESSDAANETSDIQRAVERVVSGAVADALLEVSIRNGGEGEAYATEGCGDMGDMPAAVHSVLGVGKMVDTELDVTLNAHVHMHPHADKDKAQDDSGDAETATGSEDALETIQDSQAVQDTQDTHATVDSELGVGEVVDTELDVTLNENVHIHVHSVDAHSDTEHADIETRPHETLEKAQEAIAQEAMAVATESEFAMEMGASDGLNMVDDATQAVVGATEEVVGSPDVIDVSDGPDVAGGDIGEESSVHKQEEGLSQVGGDTDSIGVSEATDNIGASEATDNIGVSEATDNIDVLEATDSIDVGEAMDSIDVAGDGDAGDASSHGGDENTPGVSGGGGPCDPHDGAGDSGSGEAGSSDQSPRVGSIGASDNAEDGGGSIDGIDVDEPASGHTESESGDAGLEGVTGENATDFVEGKGEGNEFADNGGIEVASLLLEASSEVGDTDDNTSQPEETEANSSPVIAAGVAQSDGCEVGDTGDTTSQPEETEANGSPVVAAGVAESDGCEVIDDQDKAPSEDRASELKQTRNVVEQNDQEEVAPDTHALDDRIHVSNSLEDAMGIGGEKEKVDGAEVPEDTPSGREAEAECDVVEATDRDGPGAQESESNLFTSGSEATAANQNSEAASVQPSAGELDAGANPGNPRNPGVGSQEEEGGHLHTQTGAPDRDPRELPNKGSGGKGGKIGEAEVPPPRPVHAPPPSSPLQRQRSTHTPAMMDIAGQEVDVQCLEKAELVELSVSLEKKVTKLTNRMEQQTKSFKQRMVSMRGKLDANANASAELSTAREELATAQEQLAQSNQDLMGIKAQLMAYKKNDRALKDKLEATEAMNVSIKTQLRQTLDRLDTEKVHRENVQVAASELTQEVEGLKSRVKHLDTTERQLLTTEQQLSDAQELNSELKGILESQQREVTDMQSVSLLLGQDMDALKAALAQSNKLNDAAEQEKNALKRELQESNSKVNNYESVCQSQTAEIQMLRETIEKSNKEKDTLQQQIGVLEGRAETWEERYTRVANAEETTNQNLKNEVESLKEQVNTRAKKLAQTALQREQMENDQKDTETEVRKMAERLEALQAEVQEKEHIIQSLESTATSTLEARHTTISELDTLRRELQDAQTQHLEETAYQQQTIRNLKKKMVDLKRTLSKHVRASTNQNGVNYPDLPGTDSAGSLNYPASPQMRGPNDDTYSPVYKPQTPRHDNDDQIDRTATPDAPDVMYLKNVILKFLTARSVERKQLVPVLATILNFSANESQLARSSLEKKWFST